LRNHSIGRTFIEPSQAIAIRRQKLKLNPIRGGIIEGKRVIPRDDSIVRGLAPHPAKSFAMVQKQAPPSPRALPARQTISPGYYGVDRPRREELIASSKLRPKKLQISRRRFLGSISLNAETSSR